jgi:hypothetical protein
MTWLTILKRLRFAYRKPCRPIALFYSGEILKRKGHKGFSECFKQKGANGKMSALRKQFGSLIIAIPSKDSFHFGNATLARLVRC